MWSVSLNVLIRWLFKCVCAAEPVFAINFLVFSFLAVFLMYYDFSTLKPVVHFNFKAFAVVLN